MIRFALDDENWVMFQWGPYGCACIRHGVFASYVLMNA
jgi:hypothetical protein